MKDLFDKFSELVDDLTVEQFLEFLDSWKALKAKTQQKITVLTAEQAKIELQDHKKLLRKNVHKRVYYVGNDHRFIGEAMQLVKVNRKYCDVIHRGRSWQGFPPQELSLVPMDEHDKRGQELLNRILRFS